MPHGENGGTGPRSPSSARPDRGISFGQPQTSGGEDGRGSGAPGAGLRGRRRGGGSPFWPLSAAYQESDRKAHRQKSSSVRKVPLRSLISPDARRAPAGPRPHGPGDRGRGAGAGRRRGAPAPERGGAAGPEEAAAVWAGRGTGGGAGRAAPPRRAALAASVGGWAGAGQGWARRQEPRPGWIRDRRRVDGEGRGGRDLKGPHHPLPLGAPRGGGVGGQRPGSRWAKLGKHGGARMEERTLRERWSSLRKVEATVVMSEGQLLCSRDRLRRCQAPQVCFQEDPIGNSPTPRPQALLPTERV